MTIAQLGPHVLPFLPADIPPFVNLDQVLADVADDGVSTFDPAQVDALRQIVDEAAADGIDLKVVNVELNPLIDTPMRDIATAVGEANPGSTVLALSPWYVGTYSRTYDRATLEAGQDVAKHPDKVQATKNFVSVLHTPHFDWTALTIVLVIGVALSAIVTRLLQLRSKREQPASQLVEQLEPLD